MAIALSEITEVCTSSHSKTVLVLRSSRRSDILLDMQARARFLDELQVAAVQLAAQCAGAEGDQTISIRNTQELISLLQDERKKPAGTIAYVETGTFLFLPFSQSSLLLSGAAPAFFGFFRLAAKCSIRCWFWCAVEMAALLFHSQERAWI